MTSAMSDAEFLSDFVRTHSHEAFARIVRRHIDLVYATARRLVGDSDVAEDVTQAVFLVLAKKAAKVKPGTLPGWLINTTRLASKEAIRSRYRKEKHETQAAKMRQEIDPPPTDPTSEHLWLHLDNALNHLGDLDRSTVVMRFLQDRSYAEIASAIGSTEEAVRKRASRALEKLRLILAPKGLTPSVAALTTAFVAHQSVRAPAALAASITTSAATSGGSVLLAKTVISMMTYTKIKIVALIVLTFTLVGGAGLGVHALRMARAETNPTAALPTAPATTSDSVVIAPEDQAIYDTLDKPIPGIQLQDAIEFLKYPTNLNIWVNWEMLKSIGITKTTPVILNLPNAKLSGVLHGMLESAAPGKLDYVVDRNVISISTVEDLAATPLTRDIRLIKGQNISPDQLDPKDRATQAQLDRALANMVFSSTPLTQGVTFLRDVTRSSITFDRQAFQAAGLNPDKIQVSLQMRNVKLAKLLDLTLQTAAQDKLAYTVRGGQILISTTQALKN